MTPLKEDLVLLIIQFLAEEGFDESRHSLEQEAGLFFNISYFQDSIRRGKWETAENYMNGFNGYYLDEDSLRMSDKIRKFKYSEALKKHEIDKSLNILRKAEELEELGMRLAFDDSREDNDIDAARADASEVLMALVQSNPDLIDKLVFPVMGSSRLGTLIDHSLQWQHYLCENSEPIPDIESLLVDHACADQPSSSATETPPI